MNTFPPLDTPMSLKTLQTHGAPLLLQLALMNYIS